MDAYKMVVLRLYKTKECAIKKVKKVLSNCAVFYQFLCEIPQWDCSIPFIGGTRKKMSEQGANQILDMEIKRQLNL